MPYPVREDIEYILGDALGSVRQLTDSTGEVTLARAYDPYGGTILNVGSEQTAFGYADQWGDGSGLINMRARYYSSDTGTFTTSDTWNGDESLPISLNKYLYASANPIIFTDPSGEKTYYYNRDAVASYAQQYASGINPEYGGFGDSDCTNFVSQSLKAGGMPEDNDWFFSARGGWAFGNDHQCLPVQLDYIMQYDPNGLAGLLAVYSFCGNDWAITDNLYNHLISIGGNPQTIDGSIPALSWNILKTRRKNDPNVTYAGPGEVIPSPLQLENYGDFNFSSFVISPGDVVFYRQDNSKGAEGGILFNHAAVIIASSWSLTDLFNGHTINNKTTPLIAEHSGGFASVGYIPGIYDTPNIHSINDTFSEVNTMVVVHLPDEFQKKDDCP